MAVKPVLRMGDPRLLERALPVQNFDTPELHQLIADMYDTMHALDGAGLAAPQIGVNLQLVIFGVKQNPRYPDAEEVPKTVLINPHIKPLGNQFAAAWEGCLSIPSMRGKVARPSKVLYKGFDQFGNTIERTVTGFHARVVQHECDHLHGVLYPMRIKDLSLFGFTDILFPNTTNNAEQP